MAGPSKDDWVHIDRKDSEVDLREGPTDQL